MKLTTLATTLQMLTCLISESMIWRWPHQSMLRIIAAHFNGCHTTKLSSWKSNKQDLQRKLKMLFRVIEVSYKMQAEEAFTPVKVVLRICKDLMFQKANAVWLRTQAFLVSARPWWIAAPWSTILLMEEKTSTVVKWSPLFLMQKCSTERRVLQNSEIWWVPTLRTVILITWRLWTKTQRSSEDKMAYSHTCTTQLLDLERPKSSNTE